MLFLEIWTSLISSSSPSTFANLRLNLPCAPRVQPLDVGGTSCPTVCVSNAKQRVRVARRLTGTSARVMILFLWQRISCRTRVACGDDSSSSPVKFTWAHCGLPLSPVAYLLRPLWLTSLVLLHQGCPYFRISRQINIASSSSLRPNCDVVFGNLDNPVHCGLS